MPDIQSTQSLRDILNDSGIVIDEMEVPAQKVTTEYIQLHVLRDPDTQDEAPFFSRALQWAYSTRWYSSEDPTKWLQNIEKRIENADRLDLEHAVACLVKPLLRVLVARNHGLTHVANKPTQPGHHLEPDLERELQAPDTLSRLGKKQSANLKQWMMTHLLTLLLDRIMWSITQTSLKGLPLFPNRSSADDAILYSLLHPQVDIEMGSRDSSINKVLNWRTEAQTNWLKTVMEFISMWEAYKQTDAIEAEHEGDDEMTQLQRLHLRNIILQSRGMIFPAMCALHNAVLALASLQLVRIPLPFFPLSLSFIPICQ